MLNDLLMIIVAFVYGGILLAAAVQVLTGCHAGELSLRTVAAFCIGFAGAWFIAGALHGRSLSDGPGTLLLLGVGFWIVGARTRHRNHPMRRASDWREIRDIVAATPPPQRDPWAGGPRK